MEHFPFLKTGLLNSEVIHEGLSLLYGFFSVCIFKVSTCGLCLPVLCQDFEKHENKNIFSIFCVLEVIDCISAIFK